MTQTMTTRDTARANMGLKEVVEIALVVLALIVLTVVLKAVTEVIFDEEEDASQNNMEELGRQLEKMEAGATKTMPIYVKEDLFIVGFNLDDTNLDLSSCGIDIPLAKPPVACRNKACVCLCNKEGDHPGCVGEVCYAFDDKIKLQGGTECQYLFVNGNKDPQTVYLHRLEDEARVCQSEC